MNLLKKYCVLCLFFLVTWNGFGQYFSLKKGSDKDIIRFKFVNNLVVIPVQVNGVDLSFILDSGVSRPILFNLSESDSLEIRNAEEIYLKGLGDGEPIKALKSENNIFKVGNATNPNQRIYFVMDQGLNFSPRLGFPVHGIIGYDIFRDFVVEVNYNTRKLTLNRPEAYKRKKCKSCQVVDLEIKRTKAFVKAEVLIQGNYKNVRLLVDSGSSDALWLFEDMNSGIRAPERYFDDFLGKGLSGSVYGKRAKVDSFVLAGFDLAKANVAFPDSLSLQHMTDRSRRHGSVGGEILKRFNIVFDYGNGIMILKRNANFRNPFKYNMSGIELQHNGMRLVQELASNINGIVRRDKDASGTVEILLSERFKVSLQPALEIAVLRPDSPALESGLRIGDVLLEINGKPAHKYSIQEITEMINGRPGKRVQLLVDRNGSELKFSFTLRNLL